MADPKAADTQDTAKAIELLRQAINDPSADFGVRRDGTKSPLVTALVEVLAAAVEERAAYRAVKQANYDNDDRYLAMCKRWDASKDALDAAIAKVCSEVLGDG